MCVNCEVVNFDYVENRDMWGLHDICFELLNGVYYFKYVNCKMLLTC